MMRTAYALDYVEIFREVLAEDGIQGALRFLNARTAHRFTSIYRFEGSILRNLYLYDKANPELELFADATIKESYCSIVHDTAATFVTLDSLNDSRVKSHPKRELVLSYCGVPLARKDGTLWGTLCHFDFVPHTISQNEIQFLESVAPYILRQLE